MDTNQQQKRGRGRPVMNKSYESGNFDTAKQQEFIVPASGSIDRTDFQDEYPTVDTPNWKDKAKNLAFNEEMVLVELMNDNDPQAEQVVLTAVQGINQFFMRGKAQWVKRKFLAVLATAQPESLSTPEFIDSNGDKTTRIVKNRTQKYPFRVLEDKNPNGRVWLENLMKSA